MTLTQLPPGHLSGRMTLTQLPPGHLSGRMTLPQLPGRTEKYLALSFQSLRGEKPLRAWLEVRRLGQMASWL
ncbi:hypothetical protein NDU88_007369 [Pleurodeles waltl]|uniref:Uncharacterized protein n=1 Tax=Pleurodeles waltl TaxID=8319 RepID=A0AAV7WF81_PLEWA|nr:hypothetical protein NDU88_007369 [Pleurodeles waltl]